MSLYRRKQIQKTIDFYKCAGVLPNLDYYERSLLDTADQDNSDVARGELYTMCAALIEKCRRSDPAYGLSPVGESNE